MMGALESRRGRLYLLSSARHGFDAAENIARLKHFADEAGRDFSALSISIFGARPDKALIDSYREAGIDRVVLPLPPADRDKVLSVLDRYTDIVDS